MLHVEMFPGFSHEKDGYNTTTSTLYTWFSMSTFL